MVHRKWLLQEVSHTRNRIPRYVLEMKYCQDPRERRRAKPLAAWLPMNGSGVLTGCKLLLTCQATLLGTVNGVISRHVLPNLAQWSSRLYIWRSRLEKIEIYLFKG